MSERIENLRTAIETMHQCKAVHEQSAVIVERFKKQTVWEGVVESFALTGHPKAKRAYAWSHCDGKDDQDERFVAVLEIPPVESAQTAVKVAIVAESKRKK